MYFPNLYGRTLLSSEPMQDTTPVFRGKISIVNIFSSLWAERQTATFVGLQQNPVLHDIINQSHSKAQRVEINTEDNWSKEWLIRMFMWNMRRKIPQEQHGKYFLVRKGFTEDLKSAIGMANSRVGYVYLLDEQCKIRWAGSSVASQTELESLNNGLRRLVTKKSGTSNAGFTKESTSRLQPNYDEGQQAAVEAQ